MKFRLISILFLTIFGVQIALAQSNPEPVLIHVSEEELCSEMIAHYIDTFMIELQNNGTSKGLILISGSTVQEGRNLTYLKAISGYLKMRNYPSGRFSIERSANKEKLRLEFWILPEGSEPPIFERYIENQSIPETTLFDKSRANWHKSYTGEWTFEEDAWINWGCGFDVNFSSFAETLLINSSFTGFLVIRNSKKDANKVSKAAVKKLTGTYKVPAKRLKVLVAPKLDDPEIELWLVPEGGVPPKP